MEDAAAARAAIVQYGLVLFRGYDISGEEFLQWTERLGSGHGFTRLAPGATAPRGARIGLHTEDAMLPFIPAWIWFYAARPAASGGETLLCDGAAVASALSRRASSLLENVLYWWRVTEPPERPAGPVVSDPPWIDREYRGPVLATRNGYTEITAMCRPMIRSRVGGHAIFANHLLN
ncbi:MAG: TauD/TfdA family dioxygenase, partial [Chloroflexota bacterium]|nr:TauD/TfdA family dioxygenase [Chloroflexota bacterium]